MMKAILPARTLLFVGLAIGVARANSDSECGSSPTVTVTVTASSPVTETAINAASSSALIPSSSLESPYAYVAVGTSAEATTTLSSTTVVSSTKVVDTDDDPNPLSAQSEAAQSGYYSYAEDNGSTIWLGSKTPTSGAVLATSTVVVTVQPQPVTKDISTIVTTSLTTSSSEDGTSTSFTTLSMTSFFTHYLTNEITLQPAVAPVPSARLPPHLGSYGWNATFSRVQRLKSDHHVPNSSEVYPVGSSAWPASGIVASTASYVTKRHHARQVGAVVSATINGVVASWTNKYGGEPATSELVSSIPVSSSSLALTTSEAVSPPEYSWDPSPVSSSSPAAPPQTKAAQPSSLPQATSQAASASSGVLAITSHQSSALPTSDTLLPHVPATSQQTTPLPTSDTLLPHVSATSQQTTPLPTSDTLLTQLSTQTSSSSVSLFKPMPPFSNATQTSSAAATATSSSCGSDTGLFTINFDDLPHFSTESPLSDIPPIFNPYRKLFFNGGYGYAPPPDDPYAPISPPQLAVYNYHNDSVSQASIDAGMELHGEIGAGPRVSENAYWIDGYSTWIGCANGGPSECRIDFIGYDQFDAEIAQQTLLQPPCPGLVDCKLAQVQFTNQFRDLAGLQILAYVNKTPVTFYMDDLSLGWSNKTCAAQNERASGE